MPSYEYMQYKDLQRRMANSKRSIFFGGVGFAYLSVRYHYGKR